MVTRCKRKAAIIANAGMRIGSPMSPQKGIKRNPAGYNKTKKRLLSKSQEKSASSGKTTGKYRRRKLKGWCYRKGNWNPQQRQRVVQQLLEKKLQEKQRKIDECKESMTELQSRYKRSTICWQAAVAFTFFALMLEWIQMDKPFTLLTIAEHVGKISFSSPCARVVINIFNSWRLLRSFKPLFYRRRKVYLQDYPMIRRKAYAWSRRRLFKRKLNEADLTATEMAKKMNELFVKYNVRESADKYLEWSDSTALRFMHQMKLEYGGYSKGYCDGHDRPDVLASLQEHIKFWYSHEPRMHLWIKQIELNGDNETFSWRHVDSFKLKGPGSLNRDDLPGSF